MITHSVFFSLKDTVGSEGERVFLEKAMELQSISSVRNFRCVRQVSSKNNYKFGLIMQFEDQAGYDLYNEHQKHKEFVENIWIPQVKDFMELDYIELR